MPPKEKSKIKTKNKDEVKIKYRYREVEPARGWVTSIILTVLLVVAIIGVFYTWNLLAPNLELLMLMQSGTEDPEILAQLAALDMQGLIITLIWFIVCIAAGTIFLILTIVGWVRGW